MEAPGFSEANILADDRLGNQLRESVMVNVIAICVNGLSRGLGRGMALQKRSSHNC